MAQRFRGTYKSQTRCELRWDARWNCTCRVVTRAYFPIVCSRLIGPATASRVRSEVALVRVDVEVMHHGQPVEKLTKDDFEIIPDSERRKIRVRLAGAVAKRYPNAQLRARTGYFVPSSR
jgi:hypothetical protein